MSDAADRLARSRLAILEQLQHRERREPGDQRRRPRDPRQEQAQGGEEDAAPTGAGWFAQLKHAAKSWWRYHPAHMGVELATPALSAYAARKPFQYLGIAMALGAAVAVTRPWRLISATGLLVAVAKSSQFSGLLLSALSNVAYGTGEEPDA